MRLQRKSALFVVILGVLGTSHVAADYVITELPAFATGEDTLACGINASAQVVGVDVGRRFTTGALWQNGRATNLDHDIASGINDSGQVVGRPGFLWQNGTSTSLYPLGLFFATAINNSGQIVGSDSIPNGNAILWQNGTLTKLGPGFANAINASGQIVGGSSGTEFILKGKLVGVSGSRALVWQNGTVTDLGPGYANAINASGMIVGTSNSHAVLWQNSTMTDLGPGSAEDINSFGQVVGGTKELPSSGVPMEGRALLWENGSLIDLNDLIPLNSGWTLLDATSINGAGQIVGYGTHGGLGRGFLLTPTAAPVPEPSTLLLLGIGTVGLLLGYRLKREEKEKVTVASPSNAAG